VIKLVKNDVLSVIPRTQPLVKGVLVKRYKRFLADVELGTGEVITAHCVNTGAMEGITTPGIGVWLSRSDNPKRKLQYTWELADIDGQILGVNTNLPNRIVHQLLLNRQLPWLSHWPTMKPEKKYGEKSRVDFWLSDGVRSHYLEVKNCHLVYPDGCGYFADCVSERASGHLRELAACAGSDCGEVSAEVLFFVQMPYSNAVRPSDLHDPVFAATARNVAAQGVKFSAIGLRHTLDELIVYGPLPVDLEPYDTALIEGFRTRK